LIVLLLKEECNDVVAFNDESLATDDSFVTISGFPLQLYKVLFDTILVNYEPHKPASGSIIQKLIRSNHPTKK
jgi:hypothetical protein